MCGVLLLVTRIVESINNAEGRRFLHLPTMFPWILIYSGTNTVLMYILIAYQNEHTASGESPAAFAETWWSALADWPMKAIDES